MAIELVQQTVQIPKEMKDVKDLLVVLVKDIKAKKSVAEISGDALPRLVAAIDGFDKLGEEAKSPQAAMLGGLLAGEIGEIFLAPAAPAP